LFISNPKVIEDYEKRKEKIEQLESEIEDRQSSLDKDKEKIEDLEVTGFKIVKTNSFRRPGYLPWRHLLRISPTSSANT
jgi:hypothetical protein